MIPALRTDDKLLRSIARRRWGPEPQLLARIERLGLTPTDPAEAEFLRYHRSRLAMTLELVKELLPAKQPPAKILDVGPHMMTRLLVDELSGSADIASIGYSAAPYAVPGIRHIEIDLNSVHRGGHHAVLGYKSFDIIVFCEVIEHLYTPPHALLRGLADSLAPDGVLICTTPNAVAFAKRRAMLSGIHPFERLRDDVAGHFREYSMNELADEFRLAGFDPCSIHPTNYWPQHPVTLAASRLTATLAQGFLVLARRSVSGKSSDPAPSGIVEPVDLRDRSHAPRTR